MKNLYKLQTTFFLFTLILLTSCGSDNSDDYKEISPVHVDLSTVPYPTLSQYKFFKGDMKNLEPELKVIPYDLSSTLFTDYAHKKRFVWMPEGTKATYDGDGKVLKFPKGTVLIKNFYYDNVLPNNTTRILETRLMIKTSDANGWIFADYIWNDEQTEATLDLAGRDVPISWLENGETKSINYRIPSENECFTCHKSGNPAMAIPIGPKPQNLNKNYTYADGTQNQLSRWISEGYLESAPQNITSVIDWTDTSKPLELRVRSYLDINCAHCHSEGAHCSYRSMRFAFSETTTPQNLGICMRTEENINPSLIYIVTKGVPMRSALYYRMNSVLESERMPLMGRTIVHTEAVAMINEWITNMDGPCQ
ncbi:hypothetical protein GR160_14525 [Flavobacterium sp. Sd200]|uniref:hypothetical protein n=1 Tax=Flavobacterium sp. Sd200 TaxID=2692211 RepID=UPI00136D2C6B|nr:hypothetical protein [Flavobacterium sp. Sd200]MXN92441.1 hypothetical protein [Flavobacterium sp. Sd200]